MFELKYLVCNIENKGTGFLVNPDTVITAAHVVENAKVNDTINLKFVDNQIFIQGVLTYKSEKPLDISFVKLNSALYDRKLLTLCTGQVYVKDKFSTFGFPENSPFNGDDIEGSIEAIDLPIVDPKFQNYDIKLTSNKFNSYVLGGIGGISGAPVVVDGEIVAFIKCKLNQAVGAQSLSNFIDVFNKYGISHCSKNFFQRTLEKQVLDEVKKNQNIQKYIPDIFVEATEVKESIRYFSDPMLFWKKVIYMLQRLDYSFLNMILKKIGLPNIKIDIPTELYCLYSLDEIDQKAMLLIDIIDKTINYITSLRNKEKIKSVQGVNKEEYDFFSHNFQFTDLYNSPLNKCKEHIKIIQSKLLIILDGAGQGKTNLVCDCATKLLLKKEQQCLYFNAYDFVSLDLETEIKNRICNLTKDEGIEKVFLKLLNDRKRQNEIFVIIIDGINETKFPGDFGKSLENLILRTIGLNKIRIILTCRTEYFKERFNNFSICAFNNKIAYIDKIRMNRSNQDDLLEKYLNYFNITISQWSQQAIKALTSDTLLLRIFCETYSNANKDINTNIPYLCNIYRKELFQKYTNKKFDEVAGKYTGYSKDDFQRLYAEIAQYMLQKKQYSKIPLNSLSNANLLKAVIHEDIVFREDLEVVDPLFGSKVEDVISFTFDEYRDFILAVNLIVKTDEEIINTLDEVHKDVAPVIEGLTRYIYSLAREYDRQSLIAIIENRKWYSELFLDYLFTEKDENIQPQDVEKLSVLFRQKIQYAATITNHLLGRMNCSEYKNLNITCLFHIVSNLSKEEYIKFYIPIFQEHKHSSLLIDNSYFTKIPISQIVDWLNRRFFDKKTSAKGKKIIFELLLTLLPVPYDYDPFFETKELCLRIKHENSEMVNMVIAKYDNIMNEVLKSAIEEFKTEKTRYKLGYLYKIIDLIKE